MLHPRHWPTFAGLSTGTEGPKHIWIFQYVLPSPKSIPFPGSQLDIFRESKVVPTVTWHLMLLSRIQRGPILRPGGKRYESSSDPKMRQCRKLVENNFPMSICFSAKIYPLCELPRKVKALVLKRGRFFFHTTPVEDGKCDTLCISQDTSSR